MTNARPLVSVIICVYQGARHLRQAITSALEQTYPAVEVVVVNDGSTDRSDEICRALAGHIVYVTQENAGLPRARNRGIRASAGEYIAFLDQDDVWRPDKLEKQMRLFAENPDLGLVYSDFSQIDHDARVVMERTHGSKMRRGFVLPDLYEENFVGSLTAVCRRRVLEAVGLFHEDLAFALDWDLWLRIANDHPVDFVDESLASWRWRPNYAETQHEIMLLDSYRVISLRHAALSQKLTESQRNGVEGRLARISFSLGRLYIGKSDMDRAVQWIRTSIEHDVFTPDQMKILEGIEVQLA